MTTFLELCEATVGHDEDLLRPIVGLVLGYAEPAQVAPNEGNVAVVELAEPGATTVVDANAGDGKRT
jgi:hypothetical protein